MKKTIELAVENAFEQILDRHALDSILERGKADIRYEKSESAYLSSIDTLSGSSADRLEENINYMISFWQEQAYKQGLEDSSLVKAELKKHGIY